MNEFEQKANELRQAAEMAQAEAKSAKETAEAMKAELAAKDAELKSAKESIDNLDASVKSQESAIEALRKSMKSNPMSLKSAIKAALDEKKSEIQGILEKNSGSFFVQFKTDPVDLTLGAYTPQSGSQAYGTVLDPDIVAVPAANNAFVMVFGTKPFPGSRLAWREAVTTKNVGYVAELAQNTNHTGNEFSEKFRKASKVATYMIFSSEAENWYAELVDFCTNEGQRIVMNYVDQEVWKGDGNDSTAQNHIYGIKNAATAFAGLAKYKLANVADVISDAIAQIRKEGYQADSVICSYKIEQALKGIKTTSGAYLYDQVSRMLGQVRVVPSAQLSDNEILVADSNCCDIHLGGTYELEFSRQAPTDSWRVDFRRICQTKIKTPWKKGLIYVADINTAIAAITEGSGSGSGNAQGA